MDKLEQNYLKHLSLQYYVSDLLDYFLKVFKEEFHSDEVQYPAMIEAIANELYRKHRSLGYDAFSHLGVHHHHRQTYKDTLSILEKRFDEDRDSYNNSYSFDAGFSGIQNEIYSTIIIKSTTTAQWFKLICSKYSGERNFCLAIAVTYCYEIKRGGFDIKRAKKILADYLQRVHSYVPDKYRSYGTLILHNISQGGHPSITNWSAFIDDSLKDYFLQKCNVPLKKAVDTGVFTLPWKNVIFHNGFITLYHPLHHYTKPLFLESVFSKDAFNKLPDSFFKNLNPIVVQSQDGVITKAYNVPTIEENIQILDYQTSTPNLPKTPIITSESYKKLSKTEISKILKEKDSTYLNFLCEKHIDSYPIYYSTENRTNNNEATSIEEAFIFAIHETEEKVIVVYENILIDRATIVFHIIKRVMRSFP